MINTLIIQYVYCFGGWNSILRDITKYTFSIQYLNIEYSSIYSIYDCIFTDRYMLWIGGSLYRCWSRPDLCHKVKSSGKAIGTPRARYGYAQAVCRDHGYTKAVPPRLSVSVECDFAEKISSMNASPLAI